MALADAAAFPYGLRVLVVDDDPTWLKILEKMLRKCSYEVTTCGLARVALEILRERRNKFDIVISDVNMPDMDGFKLLEHIGLEMDLPVIMMSIDGETRKVMKGVQHGACDYLLKPVRMKELRNIWQHVYRKKMHEVKEIEGHDSCDDLQILINGCEVFEERGLFMRADSDTMRKRKDMDKDHAEQESSDGATVKKARVVWSVDLHQKFVNAVNQIGFDKVGPKKILDLMNVPGLTRENVASHLQKYRLYLSRLQKQNEERIMGAARQDFSHKGPSDNLRSSFQEQPGNAANGYQHGSQKIQAQTSMLGPHLEDTKIAVPLQVPDKNRTPVSDVSDSQNVTGASPLGRVLSFERMAVNQDRMSLESMILECQPWSGSVPPKQFLQYPKHNHKRCDLLGDYSCLPKPDLEHPIAPGHLCSPPQVSSMGCSMEGHVRDFSYVKPDLLGCMKSLSPALTCTVDSVTIDGDMKFSSVEGLPNIKDCYFDQAKNQATLLTSEEASSGTGLACLPDDLPGYQLQGVSFENIGLSSIDLFQYNDAMTLPGLQNNWYDGSVPSMYWQGYYAPSSGLPPHLQQPSLLQPTPGLSVPQNLQYPGLNPSLPSGLQKLSELQPSLMQLPVASQGSSSGILPATTAPASATLLAPESSKPLLPNMGALFAPVTSLGATFPFASQPASMAETSAPVSQNLASLGSRKAAALPGSTLAYQTLSQSVSSTVATSSPAQVEMPVPLLAPSGQLLQNTTSMLSSSHSMQTTLQMGSKEAKPVESKANVAEPSLPDPLLPDPPSRALPEKKEPILPLPKQTPQKYNGSGSHNHHNFRGRGRGRGSAFSQSVTAFTEEFDFTAMNEKFNKDEVWGHLGKKSQSRDKDGELGDDVFDEDLEVEETDNPELAVKPVYVKDDFFDSLSSGTFGRGGPNGRGRFSERRRVDTETFGDFPRHRHPYRGGARGYRGGGRSRGSYYGGRGYENMGMGGPGNSYPHRGSYGRD